MNVPERKRFCPLREASLSVESMRTVVWPRWVDWLE
jgi:hypothetical protein